MFVQARPIIVSVRPPGVSVFFVETLVAVGAATIGGVVVSLFGGGTDHSEAISTLNDNVHKVNKKIHITNERIDVLSKNLTLSINNIKFILDNMLMAQQQAHSSYTIMWNLEQLKQASTNLLLLLKVADNSLTLLRSGFLNSDLLNLYTFKKVIAEGTQVYKDLEFPIIHLTRQNIPRIIPLLKICLLYTSPSPRDKRQSRMPSSA